MYVSNNDNEKLITIYCEVDVCLRDKNSTKVTVSLPIDATAKDAMLASGLIARDATPYRCFDSDENVIDSIKLSEIKDSIIYIGVPREIQAVMIEKTTRRGKVGRGRLLDGTLVHIPGLKAGEFSWVVISSRYGPKRSKASGFRVRMEGPPYRLGDYIQIKPRPLANRVRIFNPETCKWDLRLDLRVPPEVERSHYEGITWTVKIVAITPEGRLSGILDTDLTWVPDNQPELARRARRKFNTKCNA